MSSAGTWKTTGFGTNSVETSTSWNAKSAPWVLQDLLFEFAVEYGFSWLTSSKLLFRLWDQGSLWPSLMGHMTDDEEDRPHEQETVQDPYHCFEIHCFFMFVVVCCFVFVTVVRFWSSIQYVNRPAWPFSWGQSVPGWWWWDGWAISYWQHVWEWTLDQHIKTHDQSLIMTIPWSW